MIPRLWLHRRSERTAHLECRLGGHLKDRESEFNPPRFRICSAHIELRMAQLRAIVGAAFCGVLACASRPVAQVHLALGTDPTSMNVEWYSEPGDILGDGSSVVQWGAAPTKLTSSANGTNVTMTDPDTARVYSFSVATMTGLDPGSTVFYRVGNPLDGWSSVYSFVATRTDFADVPLRVGVFGDLGWQNAQALAYLETEAASGNFDFVVRRNEGWGGGGGGPPAGVERGVACAPSPAATAPLTRPCSPIRARTADSCRGLRLRSRYQQRRRRRRVYGLDRPDRLYDAL